MKKKLLKSEVDKVLECINNEYKNMSRLSLETKTKICKQFNITMRELYDIKNNNYTMYKEIYTKNDEVFKPIPNYEEYSISNYGTILGRSGNELIPNLNDIGYLYIRLCNDGITTKHRIHRLVAFAFLSNPDNLPEINHIDGNKTNNHVSNLEWCTRKQNVEHATKVLDNMKWTEQRRIKFQKSMKGKPHKKKLNEDQIAKVIDETRPLHDIMGKWGFTPKIQAIADKYGVHKETIRQIMINDKKSLT